MIVNTRIWLLEDHLMKREKNQIVFKYCKSSKAQVSKFVSHWDLALLKEDLFSININVGPATMSKFDILAHCVFEFDMPVLMYN